MYSTEESKRRFEILKMAREMLNEEYTFKRATDHNKWLVDSQEAWTRHRTTLVHPDFAPYPTEREVLIAAETLYTFVIGEQSTNKDDLVTRSQSVIPPLEKAYDTNNDTTINTARISTNEHIPDISEHIDTTFVNDKDDKPVSKEDQSGIGDLLPGWIRRHQK